MDQNWENFIHTHLSPELAQNFSGGELKQLMIERENRCWKVFLLLHQALHTSVYQAFSRELKERFSFLQTVEVYPELKDPVPVLSHIFQERKKEIWDWIQEKNAQKNVDLSCLHWQFGENQRITVTGCSEEVYQGLLASGFCTQISDWFWKEYRLSALVLVSCQHQPIRRRQTIYIDSHQEVDILPESAWESESKKGYAPFHAANSTRNYGGKEREQKKIDKTPIPIRQVEEGARNVVIEGEIFLKEATLLRDGRIAMSYFITDYSDSIVVKTFWKNASEDKIKVGQWLRVKGSVRYDPFMRDQVLFLDQYALGEKEQVRKDLCELKRVELHAHTNMSAMDALTDVRALIRRAAEWGHPAIAITDHGCIQSFPAAFKTASELKKEGKNIKILYGMEGYLVEDNFKDRAWHIILLAKNRTGLQNLYELISRSYLDHFYRKPKILRADLIKHREGLLLGSACQAGELFQAVLHHEPEEKIKEIVQFYDYLEVQPLGNNLFLVQNGSLKDQRELEKLTEEIILLGKKYQKPVVATGDVHFLEPYHEIMRSIVQAGQGYKDSEEAAPLYLRNTNEMLQEFDFLQDPQTARWIVQECPQQIMNEIEELRPIPDGFYPPVIDTAQQEILDLSWGKAKEMYGDPLPELVEKRIQHELDAIIKHDFSVLYLVAHKLVKKSNEDGFIVGSRGSVGSSFIAYLTGITEVNSLPPHYLCRTCHHFEQPNVSSDVVGVDLPEKDCPNCHTPMDKLGFDIPFETFLGFEGDKVPDIDLNFSGDYQPRAHHYVEEIFGAQNVFRAGTIATIAEKTAFGFVKKYCEEKNLVMRHA